MRIFCATLRLCVCKCVFLHVFMYYVQSHICKYIFIWLYAKLHLCCCCSRCFCCISAECQGTLLVTANYDQIPIASPLLLFSLFLLSQVRFLYFYFKFIPLLPCGSLLKRRYSRILTTFRNNIGLYWVFFFNFYIDTVVYTSDPCSA